jgi:hypothetical protein
VIANHGRVFWVADSGVAAPLLPPGYNVTEIRCTPQVCLTVYAPAGGQAGP